MRPLFTAVLACLATSAAAGPVLDDIARRGTIVIAHRESSVPFSYVDSASGQPVGYAVDLCRHFAEAIRASLHLRSLPIEFRKVTSGDRIPTIVQRRADLECGSTTNNAERRKTVAFTVGHFVGGARYLVRSDSAVNELPDFQKHKLVSTTGTTPLARIKLENANHLYGIDIAEVPDHEAGVAAVESSRADGFAMDDSLLAGLVLNRPDPARLKVVGRLLTFEVLAVMMSKSDPELKAIVDAEMVRLIRSREAYALYDRWFTQPIPPKGLSVGMPMSYYLRDLWRWPSDWAPE